MEEVWKDIALSNLPHELSPPPPSIDRRPNSDASLSGLILQDYLAGAFGEPPQPRHDSLEQLPLPPSLLSLRPDHSASLPTQPNLTAEQPSALAIAGWDRRQKRIIKNRESAGRSRARKQASLRPLCFPKLIAYTNELEMEIAQLAQENAALKKEQEELKAAMAGQMVSQVPTKGKLKRGSSAPF
ncbi:Protein FD [Platanthera zijinensis]|uniref:Protein FD n=1 Tax=Platanthera zijinensis TaxID=2320716 RepID=A0AAP0G2Y8_9ASPA